MAVAFDSEKRKAMFYPMFMKGTDTSIKDAFENQEKLEEMILTEEVVCSDYKGFLRTTRIDYNEEFDVWDCGIQYEREPADPKSAKVILLKILQEISGSKPQKWQKVQAKAQHVYQFLEDRGYYHNYKHVHPNYGMAYSGRSKSLGENIQGADNNQDIRIPSETDDYYIQFDWIAADLRILSILSEDKVLQNSFKKSDPYQILADTLSLTRDQGKKRVFQSLYGLKAEDLEDVFPELACWMKKEIISIGENGYSSSILGRKFTLEDGRTVKSAFNAEMQGSVAHAMQNVLYQVYKTFPNHILTEVHDSLILMCRKEEIQGIINKVSEIMLYPFDGILRANHKLPLKVSVGKAWKKWQVLKEYR